MTTARDTPRYLDGTSLDSPQVRYLLGKEVPDLPSELLEADTYLLSIIMATLLDGDPELTDVDETHEPL